jgi:IS1 family transposase
MNKLPLESRVQILSMLCEGSSMRAISRVTDVSFNTVAKLLVDAGKACAAFHDEKVRGLMTERVQVDEIWTFTAAKQRNVPRMKRPVPGAGDTWTWTAIDADSKLIISWLVGGRGREYAVAFMEDVAERLLLRIQLTSDGHGPYPQAVEQAFGDDVNFAVLRKIYRATPDGSKGRYSPAQCIGATKEIIEGRPDPKHISTSYAERQNLTMRMQMRRFTRLTNAFSKKFDNHGHMVALYTVWYNYVKQHKSLKGISPAMQAGISDTLWSVTDLAEMVDAAAPKLGKRGPYKKQISK